MKTKVNGVEIHYELYGRQDAPWLTFSHSLACGLAMWEPQIEAFKGRYRILAFDTRGHGASAAPAGAYTLEALADDLRGLLDHLAIERTHFVGLSMGGMIGQTFALKYPGRFESLVLADTTSRYPPDAAPIWAGRIRTAEQQGMQPLVQPTLERWFTEDFRRSRRDVVERVGAMIAATPVAGYVGCSHAIPKIDLTARLGEIRCPILVIVGDQDAGTPHAMAREIHEHAPGSKLVVIPQAAHLSNMEQPAHFNRALEDFLAAA